MNKNVRFPFRFFLITFLWSWIIWTPLILASLKIIPVSEKILSILTIPVIMIGAHGLANAFIPFMPTLIMQKNVSQPHFWIWVSLTFMIGIIIILIRDKKA